MSEHEWKEESIDSFYFGSFVRYRCLNCGGIAADIWFNGIGKPRKIKIEGTHVYLNDNCLESLKIMQTYWEKEAKRMKKDPYKKPLYKRKKKM